MPAVEPAVVQEAVAPPEAPRTTPEAAPPDPHPMDPRRGTGLSPRFAALLCWLLGLPPMTRPAITNVAVSGECVLVATDENPFFDTPLGDWGDVERNLREWGAVCEADAATVEALVRKARGGGVGA